MREEARVDRGEIDSLYASTGIDQIDLMTKSNTDEGTLPYQTLEEHGRSELVIERSRFLGHALPVGSVEEAVAFVEALRSEHYDARHVCYGLRVGRGAQGVDRSNDDGEPARTGGYPLWQLLEGEDVTDALVAVVRYYGGIKLGTGGLARAYREAGREAMAAATTVTRYPESVLELEVGYGAIGVLEHFVAQHESVRVENVAYAAEVLFRLAVRKVDEDEVRQRLGALLQRDPKNLS